MLWSLLVGFLSINPFEATREYRGFLMETREDRFDDGSCQSIGEWSLESCINRVLDMIPGASENINGLHWYKSGRDCHFVVNQVRSTEVNKCCTSVSFQATFNTCRSSTDLNPIGSSQNFQVLGTISMADINECKNNKGGCDQTCNNTPGSYHCSCKSGFVLDRDGRTCHDIDECERKIDGCSDRCYNTIGSFKCSCKRARHLLPNKKTCEDDYYEVKVMMPPQEWLNSYNQDNKIKEEL